MSAAWAFDRGAINLKQKKIRTKISRAGSRRMVPAISYRTRLGRSLEGCFPAFPCFGEPARLWPTSQHVLIHQIADQTRIAFHVSQIRRDGRHGLRMT